jgi:hypothetical protein
MSATPYLDRLLEIADKTRQANNVVRFDDTAWISDHLFDLAREVAVLKNIELPIEHLERISVTLLTHMDVILEKCRAVAVMKSKITELENKLAGIA